MMNESMFDQMEENNNLDTYWGFAPSEEYLDQELTKYNLFSDDPVKGSQNLSEEWMQTVQISSFDSYPSDGQTLPENEVPESNARARLPSRRGRHKLEEGEKQTRRKESNRKAAEKYRSKKKKEQRNSAEKFTLMSGMVEKFVTITKLHLSRCKDKDEGLLSLIKRAEHLLKNLN